MKVLSVASECAPLVKTGGLADVVGALPSVLAPERVHMRVLLPGYPQVMDRVERHGAAMEEPSLFGGRGEVVYASAPGLPDLLVLDAPHLFNRAGSIYLGPDGHDWPDNPERFAALCWVAARIAEEGVGGWVPDILHCHDWQGGARPRIPARPPGAPPQGQRPHRPQHGLPRPSARRAHEQPAARPDPLHDRGFEAWGRISALKAGLVGADRLTTVSPTYAAELCAPSSAWASTGSCGARRNDLVGILNGIDEEAWTPPPTRTSQPYADPRARPRTRRRSGRSSACPKRDGPPLRRGLAPHLPERASTS
jgi:starch synthase